MSDQTHEREALDDGLTSEFWALFCAHVNREWGPAGLAYQQAVQDAAQDANAVVKLQMVLYTQKEIKALMEWPKARLAQLKDRARSPYETASRRGPGL